MNNHKPIGIFDSGIGGLTVVKALKEALPNEQIIYFGDTAHLPYGEKSEHSIVQYSIKIAEFLMSYDVKMLVIACNSISSYAYDLLKSTFNIPVIDVIRPAIDLVIKNDYKKIGIIGTRATIGSDIHRKLLTQQHFEGVVETLATPLLVPMIEEGFFENNISDSIIKNYVENPIFDYIDAFILACTHYPLIKKQIEFFFNHNVHVIDNSDVIASLIKDFFTSNNLLSKETKEEDLFFVSDYTFSFEQTAKLFFGEKIKIQEKNLWND